MFNFFKSFLFLIFSVVLLIACSDSEAPQEKVAAVSKEKAIQLPVEVAEIPVVESVSEMVEEMTTPVEEITGDVVTEVEETVVEVAKEVKEETTAMAETVLGDKPYQLVDGAISANAIEGWKTYNGGGCGSCHGQGGSGAIGPNLGESVTKNLTKEQFVDVVANGRSGTFMKPHKTNKRVMDNLDNLYAYFMARGDDVLGPGNLIKMPFGK